MAKGIHYDGSLLDITAPEFGAQVEVAEGLQGLVIWINVDGVARLRICQVKLLEVKLPNTQEITFNRSGE